MEGTNLRLVTAKTKVVQYMSGELRCFAGWMLKHHDNKRPGWTSRTRCLKCTVVKWYSIGDIVRVEQTHGGRLSICSLRTITIMRSIPCSCIITKTTLKRNAESKYILTNSTIIATRYLASTLLIALLFWVDKSPIRGKNTSKTWMCRCRQRTRQGCQGIGTNTLGKNHRQGGILHSRFNTNGSCRLFGIH